ncbi:fimbrillin family protein [Parabacteroides caecihominis]|jgi:hypothetical protein|nr:fimbrillin family protein [Parabacteroides sp. TA-V-105]MCM0714132.1 fimbrillin family protein [Parabacteroides sp. TA-V-105]
MKKSLLSMAALALIMASCSNDEENVIDNGEAANAVPVQISQTVTGVESKAAIIPGNKMDAVIIMVDGNSSNASAPDFDSFAPKKDNTLNNQNKFASDADRANYANTQFTASTTANEIILTPTLYYPVDGDASPKKTWILGVVPQGTVSGTTVTFTQTDGLQDVMFAGQQAAGSGATSDQTKAALNFQHKTTQLTFVAKLSKSLDGTEWANKTVSVKDITIQSAQVPASLAFNTGTVNWKDAANLMVAGCNTALSTTPCAPSVPVMVKPATNILVNIDLSVEGAVKSYTNLIVKKEDGTANLSTSEGFSHQVTFNITPPTAASGAIIITASAKIEPWKKGDAGKVDIE